MEKQVNSNSIFFKLYLITLLSCNYLHCQDNYFDKGKFYTIGEITVSGIKSFSPQTVIAYTGLRKGQQIRIPGDDISAVINKLWKLELFSDINFYLTRIEGDTADIEIFIKELQIIINLTKSIP